MNFKELKELIDIVSSKETIEELEVERNGSRVRIKRVGNYAPAPLVREEPSTESPAPAPAHIPAETGGLSYVSSPLVGTFYRAPSPDSDPFVNVGDFVEKGSVVCIIEAMKLMNEIESDVAGEVVSISVENGHPIEYGERLVAIRPR
jgi:acetyl-CoA carboxylase biotin carboxyl carrier protein